ncbi:MAG: hypothetical protein ACRC0X_07310, partial [Brevinema sp.]
MKYLLFVVLFSTNFTYSNEFSTERIKSIIRSLEKKDYSILDQFLEKTQLYPNTKIKNGYTVDCYSTDNINITRTKTNHIVFSNTGVPISYTNQYGVLFLESQTLLIPLEQLTNLRESKCSGFEWAIEEIYHSTNLESILNIDQCFFIDSSYRGIVISKILGAIKKYILSANKDQEILNQIGLIFDNQYMDIYNYIINQLLSQDFDEVKLSIMNSYIFNMLSDPYNINKIDLPAFQDNEICYIKD